MGIFGKIRDTIFGHEAAVPPTATPVASPAAIDVEQVLISISGSKGNPDLNWRTSIVDLLKLLDLDPGLESRKQLATELGYKGAPDGSAEMHIWLHKEVMRQLAANGGKVPASMTD